MQISTVGSPQLNLVWALKIACLSCLSLSVHTNAEIAFQEVSEAAGVSFVHQSGAIGKRWTVEITGAGVGVLDFDGDGKLDIWAIQGGPLKYRTGNLPGDRLFRNVSKGDKLRFVDVTDRIGLAATQYGMGIVTGDIDNDGDIDLVLLNFGRNQLFRNDAGKFTEVLDSPIAQDTAWSLSGSFADLNNDGWLDLYVANYVAFPLLDEYRACRRLSLRIGYCAPSNFEPQLDQLFINDGKGSFQDMSVNSGIQSRNERGMGVIVDDLNADGKPDIYVANDMAMNFLWLNRTGATFEEDALLSGIAVNGHGMREASMGVAIADVDRDFDPDIFLTHDLKESNTLYTFEHAGWFSDQSIATGLGPPSLSKTGFGTVFFDVENDGDSDLFVANGSVSMIDSQIAQRIEPPLRQTNQLFVNDGYGNFEEHASFSLNRFEEVSRGVAMADLDNDGDIDLVVSNNDGRLRIQQNDSRANNGVRERWIGVRAMIDERDGVGAVVWLESDSAERKTVHMDGSYASASDARIVFGLGESSKPQTVHVKWPDGTRSSFDGLAVNRYHVLRKPPR